MKLSINTVEAAARRRRPSIQGRLLSAAALGTSVGLGFAGHAFAQAASPAGGIGAQANLMSGEAINAGGTAFGMACYIGAAICFLFGVWAFWQSRQEQNRGNGYIGRGFAGLILCGLFTVSGVWINKAAVTTSGGNATINDTPAMVQFGAGG